MHFSDEPAEPVVNNEPPDASGRRRRILVVDDNLTVLKAFELKLRANGFDVFTTTNAASVAKTVEETQAELIILDINFPPAGGGGEVDWNGFKIMQWLRRFPELADIPVILITGEDLEKYRSLAEAAGTVAFFQKPVVFKQLLAAILQVFGTGPKLSPGKT